MTLWVNLTRVTVNGGCIGAFWDGRASRQRWAAVERP
jgi:hypothetical protein